MMMMALLQMAKGNLAPTVGASIGKSAPDFLVVKQALVYTALIFQTSHAALCYVTNLTTFVCMQDWRILDCL